MGTEEGTLYVCSKAYNSKFLRTIEAHTMAIYAVRWSPFHKDIFATCSADWSVKIWHLERKTPLVHFDLGSPVGDVAWSPHLSTVFAIVTEGKCVVYDLSQSKYEALCTQPIVRKSKLTHVEFNPSHHVIMVGDDRGNVTTLKISPNLRKGVSGKKPITAEQNLEKIQKIVDLHEEL